VRETEATAIMALRYGKVLSGIFNGTVDFIWDDNGVFLLHLNSLLVSS
jgi:hypothetical protein